MRRPSIAGNLSFALLVVALAFLFTFTPEASLSLRTLESRAERIRRETRGDVRAPPPTISPEEVAKLPFAERQKLLQSALPGRAPAPPGWDAADVGGVPWHMQPKFLEPTSQRASANRPRTRSADCS